MKKNFIILGVFIILLAFLFLLPDSFFNVYKLDKKDKKIVNNIVESKKETLEKEKETLNTIKERLSKNKYEYEYNLDSPEYIYYCIGKVEDNKNTGKCTSPKEFTYTEENGNVKI